MAASHCPGCTSQPPPKAAHFTAFDHAGVGPVMPYADTYVPGPPYCAYGLRVPVPRAAVRTAAARGTGQLAPRAPSTALRRARTSPWAYRTYRVPSTVAPQVMSKRIIDYRKAERTSATKDGRQTWNYGNWATLMKV